MFVTARIDVPNKTASKPVLTIPQEAIIEIEGKKVVFLAGKEDGTFIKHEVSVGPAMGDYVQVFGGLKKDQKLVVEHPLVLKAELGKPAGDED